MGGDGNGVGGDGNGLGGDGDGLRGDGDVWEVVKDRYRSTVVHCMHCWNTVVC